MDGRPLQPILAHILTGLAQPEHQQKTSLVESWAELVGNRFAQHTKPQFGQNGKITIWVDDSTLAFELSQRYKATLLKRLKHRLGDDQVSDIRFYVGQIH